MKRVKFKGWTLIVDIEATQQLYAKWTEGSAERCGCDNCKNFIANRNNAYPNHILTLFDSLGIDYTKELDVNYISKSSCHQHFYDGSFYFVGSFIGKNCWVQLDKESYTRELQAINDNLKMGFFSTKLDLFGNVQNTVEIFFIIGLPWKIDKHLDIN